MKIKMTKNQRVSPDGIIVQLWKEGEIHDANDKLAELLIKEIKCAVKEINPIPQTEEKKIGKEEKKIEKEEKKVEVEKKTRGVDKTK